MDINITPDILEKHPEIIEEQGEATIITPPNPVRYALCIMLGIDTDSTDKELLERAKEFANE